MDFNFIVNLFFTYGLKVVGAILTLIIGFWIAGRLARLLETSLNKRNADKTLVPFLTSLVKIGIRVLVLLSVAGMFGIETTSFIAIFGALAFAVGLALQGSLSHFASGVMILFFKPYQVGDFISAGGFQAPSKRFKFSIP